MEGRCPAPARQRAPVTGRACAAWRIDLAEQLGGPWLGVASLRSLEPFDLEAEGLRAQVQGPVILLLRHGEEAELDARPRPSDDALRRFCAREGIALLDERGLPRRLRFRETVLLAGDAFGVVGKAGPLPKAAALGYRESAATRSIVGQRRMPAIVTNDTRLLATAQSRASVARSTRY
ncbi:MAG: hypothetical protein AAF447_00995 [Myxococcota bacterium]